MLTMQGTVVTAGRARAIAIGTGQDTAIGQIRQARCIVFPLQ